MLRLLVTVSAAAALAAVSATLLQVWLLGDAQAAMTAGVTGAVSATVAMRHAARRTSGEAGDGGSVQPRG